MATRALINFVERQEGRSFSKQLEPSAIHSVREVCMQELYNMYLRQQQSYSHDTKVLEQR